MKPRWRTCWAETIGGKAWPLKRPAGPRCSLALRRWHTGNHHAAWCTPKNQGSIHVLEKLGLTFVDRNTYFGMEVNRYAAQASFFRLC